MTWSTTAHHCYAVRAACILVHLVCMGLRVSLPAGSNSQPVPEDKQTQFQQTYTVLIAFLTVILPPIITQGVDEVSSTDQEVALGKYVSPVCCSPQCLSFESIPFALLMGISYELNENAKTWVRGGWRGEVCLQLLYLVALSLSHSTVYCFLLLITRSTGMYTQVPTRTCTPNCCSFYIHIIRCTWSSSCLCLLSWSPCVSRKTPSWQSQPGKANHILQDSLLIAMS